MRKDRLLAFVLITTGGLIYILYRPKNLLLFRVSDFLGLDSYIEIWREKASVITLPSFVINSIPAGLWTASYLILICDCTRYYNRKTRLLISLPLPVSAILLEFLQLPGWCSGVFDIYDIICYLIPIIIFIKVI